MVVGGVTRITWEGGGGVSQRVEVVTVPFFDSAIVTMAAAIVTIVNVVIAVVVEPPQSWS